MTQGIILKGIGGFYTVQAEDGALHTCKARGRLRKQGQKPMVGDAVRILEQKGQQDGCIEEILPRKNAFVRPPVANVDQLVPVLSADWPPPDLLLYDKLRLAAAAMDVRVLWCINKCDAASEDAVRALREQLLPWGDRVLCTCAASGAGVPALAEQLRGSLSALAGQSGVGKSTLINAVFPQLELRTGGKAQRAPRGTHTTRHVELLTLPGGAGRVLDTPGFSLLSAFVMSPEELPGKYPDFARYARDCHHADCLHRAGDGAADARACGVAAAVARGEICAGRFERYLTILQELWEHRRKQYD